MFYNGFTAERSFGSHSYFVRHERGNWLIDSPRYLEPLARRFESLGGIAFIFLTHRDDVADAAKYARRFGARRIIHRRELAAQPEAEIVIDSLEPIRLDDDFLVVPTPGHTAGHCVLNHANRYLFTGDHLWWDRDTQSLDASREYCWWSWETQLQSLARLQALDFEWVLPGHGQRVQLPGEAMQCNCGRWWRDRWEMRDPETMPELRMGRPLYDVRLFLEDPLPPFGDAGRGSSETMSNGSRIFVALSSSVTITMRLFIATNSGCFTGTRRPSARHSSNGRKGCS